MRLGMNRFPFLLFGASFTVLGLFTVRPSAALVDYMPEYFPPQIREESRLELGKIIQQFIERAGQRLDAQDVTGAVKLLNAAIQVLPNDYRPYSVLAGIYLRFYQPERFWQTLELSTRYYTDTDAVFPEMLKLYGQAVPGEEVPAEPFVAPFRDNKKGAFSFMFDDGERSVVTGVVPLFYSFGMMATIPINPGHTVFNNENPWRGNWADWLEAASRGFEIANHSMSHMNLAGLSDKELALEINNSHDRIAKITGQIPYSFVFPFNQYDDNATAKAKELHGALRQPEALRQVYPRTFVPIYGGDLFSLDTANKLVDFAVQHNFWIVPVCHGMLDREIPRSYKPVSRDFLTGHLNYLKQRQDEVWVDTFGNIYRYLWARVNTRLKVESRTEKNVRLVLTGNKTIDPGQELTVIIPLEKPARFATARFVGGKEFLGAQVKDRLVWLNVPVNGQPVEVMWK
jgi:peptidoglycan/xylan/chitin deacetylase (PgdA/CDA1 family)